MSDKKQRRLPKIGVRAGDVHDFLTPQQSKPVAHGCTLPETGNGGLMNQDAGNTMHTGGGEKDSVLPPTSPVKAVAHQQRKLLSKRSSMPRNEKPARIPADQELNSSCKLPDINNAPVKSSRPKSVNVNRLRCVLPSVSEQREELNKNLKLPSIKPVAQSSSSSSWSDAHKTETAVLRPAAELDKPCKLPDISARAKHSRPKSVNPNRPRCALPSIAEQREKLKKKLFLPSVEKMTQWSSSSFWSAVHKHQMPAELSHPCKLPEIGNTQAKRSRSKNGNMNRLPLVLPPISKQKEEPHRTREERAESPRMDKAKKKKVNI